jgi:hypothetical protein
VVVKMKTVKARLDLVSTNVKGFGRRPIATVGAGTGAVVGKPQGRLEIAVFSG